MKFFKIFVVSFIMIGATSFVNAQTEKTEQTENTKTITAKVKGITCGNDLKTLSNNVEKLDGVTSCKAGKAGASTTFNITFDPNVVSEKEIYAAIENTDGCKNPNEKPYKVK